MRFLLCVMLVSVGCVSMRQPVAQVSKEFWAVNVTNKAAGYNGGQCLALYGQTLSKVRDMGRDSVEVVTGNMIRHDLTSALCPKNSKFIMPKSQVGPTR